MASTSARKLAREFRDASKKAEREVPKVVAKTALQIKRHWSLDLKSRSIVYAQALPYAVDYSTQSGTGWARAEIGPNKSRRQGALGNLLEFGSENNPAGYEGEKALDSEERAFYRYIDEATNGMD